jgi:hypothetical protein
VVSRSPITTLLGWPVTEFVTGIGPSGPQPRSPQATMFQG